jgi:hypothetical protein
LDGSGNVVVTGDSVNASGSDSYTAKYAAADGVLLWEKRAPSRGAQAVAVDGSGNVLVTGGYTVKYAAVDGALLWEKPYRGYGAGGAVSVDGSGNVVVTGYSSQCIACDADYYTAKYAADGGLLWEKRYNGSTRAATDSQEAWNGYDYAWAMTVDGSGNVFVTGGATGSNGYYDYATIKYSSAIPPSLTVARTTTNTVVISWPSPSTGFVLQQNDDALSSPGWSYVTDTIQNDGTNKTLVVNPSSGSRFYRLVKP